MNNKTIGRRIKNIRMSLGMTTEEFAEKFEDNPASKGTVSKWENGHYIPNNKRLKKIAELGNISVEELLYGSLDDYANQLLKELLDKLKKDSSIDSSLIDPIIKQVNIFLYPSTNEPLEVRFNNSDNLKENFEWYSNKAINEWKNPESREINIIRGLQHDINDNFNDYIGYMYKSTYKNNDNTSFTLGIEDGMNEFLYNELIKMQGDTFKSFSELEDKYDNK